MTQKEAMKVVKQLRAAGILPKRGQGKCFHCGAPVPLDKYAEGFRHCSSECLHEDQ